MKKSKFVFLTLVSLSLLGCTGGRISVGSESSSFSSEKESVSEKKESSPSSKESSSDKLSSFSSDKGSSMSSKNDSSSQGSSMASSSQHTESGWSDSLELAMTTYLGGTLLPYIDMGKSVSSEWNIGSTDFGVLTISGSAKWVDGTTLDNYEKKVQKTAGWSNIVKAGTYLTADHEKGKVHLRLTKDDGDYLVLSASYDEPYDKSAATGWKREIERNFLQVFSDPYVIPFVYLGTRNPISTLGSKGDSVSIIGGKWNYHVLADSKDGLDAAGFTSTINGESMKATKKAENQIDTIEITIEKNGYSGYEHCSMTAKLIEGFHPGVETQWPDAVKDDIAQHLDNHSIPYVYLGSSSPTSKWTSYSGTYLTITGSTWDSQVLTLAQTAFDAIQDAQGNKVWTSSLTSSRFTASMVAEDGCELSVSVSESYSGHKAEMRIDYVKGYNPPKGEEAKWNKDLLNEFALRFPGHQNDIPYIYLNTDKVTTSWSDSSSTLTLNGGAYNGKMMDIVKADYENVLDEEGKKVWTTSFSAGGYYTYDTLSMTATMKDGCIFRLSLEDNSLHDVRLKIAFEKKYEVPAGLTQYDEDSKKILDERMGADRLPFVYMNTDKVSTSFDPVSQCITMNGGMYQKDMFERAKSAFKAQGWDVLVDDSSSCDKFVATKEYTDSYYSVEFTDNAKKAKMKITLEQAYLPEGKTSYREETKKEIKSFLGEEELPFVYLGTSLEDAEYTSYDKTLTLYGNLFSNKILTSAKAVFDSAEGYQTALNEDSLTVYKQYGDGSFLVGTLYKSSYGYTTFKFAKDEKIDATTGDYPEKLKGQYLKDTGGHEIPYIYMGDQSLMTYSEKSQYSMPSINGKTWSSSLALNAKKVLEADDWNVSLGSDEAKLNVTADKTFSDNAHIRLFIYKTYNGANMRITYSAPYQKPEDMNSWSKNTIRTMKKAMDMGDEVLPFFYIGTDSPEIEVNNGSMTIKGTLWNEQILEDSKKALEENGYTTSYDYCSAASYVTKRTYGVKEVDGRHLTVIVSNSSTNVAEITVYYMK